MYEKTAEKRRLCYTSLVARYAQKELNGDHSKKDCCVTQRWWLATLVETRRGSQRKGLLCHTALVACYARLEARYARKELDGDYSEKDCCVTQQ